MKRTTALHTILVGVLLIAASAAGANSGTNPGAVSSANPGFDASADAAASADSCPAVAAALHQYERLAPKQQTLTLANGLTVVLAPDPDARTVAVVTSVRVGARDEIAGEGGYAHLFEHLLFRGSETISEAAYNRVLIGAGGEVNAQTDYDRTYYYLSAPAEALPQLLWLEAQRFRAPKLDAATLAIEIQAVLEEMALRIDNVPFLRSGAERLLKQLQGSDYDHLVIGSEAELRAATVASVQAFYQRHYRPERIVLAIAGRFDPATVSAQLLRDWADWPGSGQPQTLAPLQRPTIADLHATLIDKRAPWPALAVAWLTVPDDHPDAMAISLLQDRMLRGEAGVVRQQLLAQNLLLHSAELPMELPRLGLAHFIAVPRASASLAQLEQAIADAFATFVREPLSEAALCELKTARARRLLAGLESPLALAYGASLDHTLWQQSRWQAQLLALQHVQPRDLQRVAAHYFVGQSIRLQLLPAWHVRWAKRLLEWLPSSWSDALEESAL